MTVVVGVLVFMAVSTTLATAFAEFAGCISQAVAIPALLLGVGAGLSAAWKTRKISWNFPRPAASDLSWELTVVLCFGLFAFRFFGWLYYEKGSSFYTLDPNNFGDLPWHITSIENLARTTTFWPANPILSGEQFHYPFGIDLFSALFVKLGVSVQAQLPVIGFFSVLMLLVVLYLWAGGFGLGAFLFSGGLKGFEVFQLGYPRDFQADLAWKNLPLALYMTQRGFLYALPAGLLVLWSWRRRFFTDKEPLPFWLEGLLWGTMPLFHVHTFLFMSAFFAVFALTSKNRKASLREGLKIFGVAVIPATYEMLRLTDNFHRASILSWRPGWMIEFHRGGIGTILDVFGFFFWNYGLFVPLTLWAGWLAWKSKKEGWHVVIVTAGAIYLLCLFVMFAPWDWDNTKLMAWSYVMALPVIWEFLVKPLTSWIKLPLLGCLFLSGFVCLYAVYVGPGYELYGREAKDRVCHVLETIPHEARIAIAQAHNHPVLLCGHMAVAGYAGHLWSHGIPGHEIIEAKLKKMMMGDPEWRQLAKEIQARYLFWGPMEEHDFNPSSKPWLLSAPVVATGSWGTLYDLGQ